MVESGRVPGKDRPRATIEKLCGRVLEKGIISVSTRNGKNPVEYRENVESMPLLKNCPNKFRKKVGSV